MLSSSIKNQTVQIFKNIEILFDAIPAEEFNAIKGGFKTWKHFYHLVHSLDKYFIDPSNFTEPEIHTKDLDIIYIVAAEKVSGVPPNTEYENLLTKDEIKKYYENVKNKIQIYLNDLKEETLENTVVFQGMKFTKMELILAQLRHVFYHVGYLHCCIKIEKGETPEYIGLY